MSELTEGLVVVSRYRLEQKLGEGGMGEVWAARDLEEPEHARVALKFLKGKVGPTELRRFQREARAAMAVKHPNVVRIHRVVDWDGLPVMVMDLLDGESLGERLEHAQDVLPLEELATLLLPIISALGTAHAMGIVHRDLKPDNVFLQRMPDGTAMPKVLDFGIAKLSAQEGEAASTGALTSTGAMLGTPYYMAPEQAFGEKDVDSRADVWAMGVILYHALTGKRPVDGDNLGQLMKLLMTGNIPSIHGVAPTLPEDVRDLITRMLTTDRSRRCQSMTDAYVVLSRYTSATAPSFRSVPPAEQARSHDALLEALASTEVMDPPPDPSASPRPPAPGAEAVARPPDDALVLRPSALAVSVVPDVTPRPVSGRVAESTKPRVGAWGVALGLGLVGLLGAGAWMSARSALPPAGATAPTQVVAPSASVGPAVESPSAPPSVLTAPAAAVAEGGAATTPSLSARPATTGTPRVAPKPQTSATASPSSKPASPPLPGQMQENVPF